MTAGQSSATLPADDRRGDPTMEEILASIRKIIADDEPQLRAARPVEQRPRPVEEPRAATPVSPAAAPVVQPAPRPAAPFVAKPAAAPPAAAAPAAFVPPAAFSPAASAPAPSAREPVAPEAFTFPVPPPEPTVAAVAAEPRPAPQAASVVAEAAVPDVEDEAADEGGALVSSATTTSVSSAFQALSASVALTSGDMIERHVREMLRPMLKQWLDDNLPTIVERLVRAEIERVARGGR